MSTQARSLGTITCAGCAKSQASKLTPKGQRVPAGWKRREQSVYCPKCWKQLYRLRAVTFPVAEVLEGGDWAAFREALAAAWGQSTRLANWAVTELAKADVQRKAGDTKLAPMPAIYLYNLWQEHYERDQWTGAAQSAQAIMRSVESKYRRIRLDVIWRGAAVLPRHRYPVPYPVHNAAWHAAYWEYEGTDGHMSKVPIVSVPMGGRRWTLRLRSGSGCRRQLKAFRQIVAGEAVSGELALYRVRSSNGAHRATAREKAPRGGAQVRTRIMVKLVAWLPRQQGPAFAIPPPAGQSIEDALQAIQRYGREGMLEVRTGSNALFIAFAPGREEPWLLHADHVRRWIARHRRQLERIADDTKAERRRPRREKRGLLDCLDVLTHRQHCRLDTFCHTAARQLVGWAERSNVLELRYDDRNQGYFTDFPWFKLRQLIADKCDELGLDFVHVQQDELAEPDASVEVLETPSDDSAS